MGIFDKIKDAKKNAEIDKYIKYLETENREEYRAESESGAKIVHLVCLDKCYKTLFGEEAIRYRKQQQQYGEKIIRVLKYCKKEKNYDVARKLIEVVDIYGKLSQSTENPYELKMQLQLPDDIANKIVELDKKVEDFDAKMRQEMINSIDEVMETIER